MRCYQRNVLCLRKILFLNKVTAPITDRRDMVSLHEVYTIKIWWKPVQFPWCTPDFNEVSSFCGNVMEILCKLDTYTKVSIVETIPLRPV
ncbi:unnamed protein product [Rhizophagus irregularis]|nr:unnamed protein product [Rhizophagus irregularis]